MPLDLSELDVTFVPGVNYNCTSLEARSFQQLGFLPLSMLCAEITRAGTSVLQAAAGACISTGLKIHSESSVNCPAQSVLQAAQARLRTSATNAAKRLCRQAGRVCRLSQLARHTNVLFYTPACQGILDLAREEPDCNPACDDTAACMMEFHTAAVDHVGHLRAAAVADHSGLSKPWAYMFNMANLDPTTAGNGDTISTRAAHLTELLQEIAIASAVTRDADTRDQLKMAEIGVNTGSTSVHLLRRFPRLHMLLVDPYIGSADFLTPSGIPARTWEALTPYSTRIKFRVQRSTMVAPSVANGSLDLVFIDGDHSYKACRSDIEAWLWKVRPGGVLAGHDYAPRYARTVARAVNDFVSRRDLKLHLNGENWWVYLA